MGENNFRVCEEVQHNWVFVAEGRMGGGGQKTQVYMPSRGMNALKSDLISDPAVGKAFKYHAQYPGVMQESQEGKLMGPTCLFRSKRINENSTRIFIDMLHLYGTRGEY